jgi:hypothetical protein
LRVGGALPRREAQSRTRQKNEAFQSFEDLRFLGALRDDVGRIFGVTRVGDLDFIGPAFT